MPKLKNKTLLIYMFFLYIIWGFVEFFIQPYKLNIDIWSAKLLKEVLLKTIVWIVPSIVLIRKFRQDLAVSINGIYSVNFDWIKYLPLFLLFFVINVTNGYFLKGTIGVHDTFSYWAIVIVMFTGLTGDLKVSCQLPKTMLLSR